MMVPVLDALRVVALVVVATLGLVGTVAGQETPVPPPVPPADIPNVEPRQSDPLALPEQGEQLFPSTRALPSVLSPYAPSNGLDAPGFDLSPAASPELLLSARLTEDGEALRSGVVWRIFGADTGPDGRLPLINEGTGGEMSFQLKPGVYFVHCQFGSAGTTVRVELDGGLFQENVVLNAGGLVLLALADESPLPIEDVRFDVYSLETDARGERKVVARDVRSGEMLRLTADTYHVVSRYGTVNAQTRADVEVKAGKLTEVSLYQRAAEVTLKLVGEPGGEAIADTRWSVLTPGGDIVTEGVGAFPSFILASGEYRVVARHAERVYQRSFEVETGRHGEVEVLAAR